ncbi:MAG TPA: iron uptake system protein EfeO [Acidimicrobiales bacterium]
MVRNRFIVAAAVALTLGTLGAACGSDDGAGVRDGCGASASGGSASGGASGSACADPGSGSGIADDVEGSSTDNPLVRSALADYTTYVSAQVDDTIAKTTTFTDAVRAGHVEAAKAAYAPSRQGWESIEPIAGLVEEIDGAVDSRVDDFAGADDPAFTGWHRLEYILWEQGTTDGAAPFADRLDADLQTLKTELADLDIPPAALAVGSSELIEEVSTGKISGEEDRYSGTDLWDFAANVAGSEKAFDLLEPAIEQEDPDLAAEIGSLFTELDGQLAAYEDGAGGYQTYTALTDANKTVMQTTLADLSEKLSTVAGVLGLEG